MVDNIKAKLLLSRILGKRTLNKKKTVEIQDPPKICNKNFGKAVLPDDIAKIQEDIITVFHERDIKSRKGYKASHGVEFKRGNVGGILDEACLELLPTRMADKFKAVINEKGVVLVHFNGNMLTIPPEYLSKAKKTKSSSEQKMLGI